MGRHLLRCDWKEVRSNGGRRRRHIPFPSRPFSLHLVQGSLFTIVTKRCRTPNDPTFAVDAIVMTKRRSTINRSTKTATVRIRTMVSMAGKSLTMSFYRIDPTFVSSQQYDRRSEIYAKAASTQEWSHGRRTRAGQDESVVVHRSKT